MKPNKCIKFFNKNVHSSVSYDFSNFNLFKKNQSVTFLVISPKDGLALLFSFQENQNMTFLVIPHKDWLALLFSLLIWSSTTNLFYLFFCKSIDETFF
jgi:hypothetical protein